MPSLAVSTEYKAERPCLWLRQAVRARPNELDHAITATALAKGKLL